MLLGESDGRRKRAGGWEARNPCASQAFIGHGHRPNAGGEWREAEREGSGESGESGK
jgi:hypothetical protein